VIALALLLAHRAGARRTGRRSQRHGRGERTGSRSRTGQLSSSSSARSAPRRSARRSRWRRASSTSRTDVERGEGVMAFREADVDLGDLTGVVLEARLTKRTQPMRADRIEPPGGRVVRRGGRGLHDLRVPEPDVGDLRAGTSASSSTDRDVRGRRHPRLRRAAHSRPGRPARARRSQERVPRAANRGRRGRLPRRGALLPDARTSATRRCTPELRTERGVRGLGELRYALAPDEGGTLSGFYGHDEIEDRWRSAVGIEHGWAPGPVRTGVRGEWVSDTDVLADYGDTYLARSTPGPSARDGGCRSASGRDRHLSRAGTPTRSRSGTTRRRTTRSRSPCSSVPSVRRSRSPAFRSAGSRRASVLARSDRPTWTGSASTN
jgi:hypothetical protein